MSFSDDVTLEILRAAKVIESQLLETERMLAISKENRKCQVRENGST